MTVKELIKRLSELPEEATIGTASFDEAGEHIVGHSYVSISNRKDVTGGLEDGVTRGQKNLDYYIVA
jgi:hypothetical protein